MVAPFSYFLLVLIQEEVLGYMSCLSRKARKATDFEVCI